MLGRPLIRFDAVPSTMTVLADLADAGAPEGATVVAGFQSAGRGRADRQWLAPANSAVLTSVLLRPDLPLSRLSALSILVADAICASLNDLYSLETQIKWPNDVLIGGRKISGILIRTRSGFERSVVIVGMGINANIPPDELPPHGTSVLAELGFPVERDVLLQSTLQELETRYQELLSGDLERRWQGIHERLAMRNELVRVQEGKEIITGVLKRIDADGALVLDLNGYERRVMVGDLSRGPTPVDNATR